MGFVDGKLLGDFVGIPVGFVEAQSEVGDTVGGLITGAGGIFDDVVVGVVLPSSQR